MLGVVVARGILDGRRPRGVPDCREGTTPSTDGYAQNPRGWGGASSLVGEHATAGESAGGKRGDGGSIDGGAWYLAGGVRRREEEQAWVLGD